MLDEPSVAYALPHLMTGPSGDGLVVMNVRDSQVSIHLDF
jgi:hypothetical protein